MPQTQICRGVKTAVVYDDTGLTVIYRGTRVVHQDSAGKITLRTGGWKSATMRTRMNQASNEFDLGYQVFQRNFDWYVRWRSQDVPFPGDTVTLS